MEIHHILKSSLIGRQSFLGQKIGTDERKIQGNEWKSDLRCQKYSTRDSGPPYLQLISLRIRARPALVILGKLLPEEHFWNKKWRSSEEIKHKYSGPLKCHCYTTEAKARFHWLAHKRPAGNCLCLVFLEVTWELNMSTLRSFLSTNNYNQVGS